MKKEIEKNLSLEKALKGIKDEKFLKGSLFYFLKERKWEHMTTDISAAESAGINIDKRYTVQEVEIPTNKRGNLRKYRGKKVQIICTTIAHNGPRINFHIKEK